MLLCRGHGGFGGIYLCFRRKILRLRIVDFLLRDQPGLPCGGLLQPLELRVNCGMFRFCAVDFVLCARNLLLALLQLEDRLLQLRFQFRHFKHGNGLALVNHVADIDVDVRHVSAHLGVHIDNLEWLELPGQRQHVRDIAALRCRYAGRGDGGGIRRGVLGPE